MISELAVQSSNVSKDVGFETRSLGSRALLPSCSTSNSLKARKLQKGFTFLKVLREVLRDHFRQAPTQVGRFSQAKRLLRVRNTNPANRVSFGFFRKELITVLV